MRSGARHVWNPPAHVKAAPDSGGAPAKWAGAGDGGRRLHLQPGPGAASGGSGAGHAERTASAPQAQVWQVHYSSGPSPARQPAAPPGAWHPQPISLHAASGPRWAPQQPSAEEGLLRKPPHTPPPGLERIHHSPSHTPTSWQSEESCACEALHQGWSAAPPGLRTHHPLSCFDSSSSFESEDSCASEGWSAAPLGFRLDRLLVRDDAALVDFAAGDPCQRRALGGFPPRMFLSESLRGSHALSPQATGAAAPADTAPDAISLVDPDCNVSFFPDFESCCESSGGRAFRVGIAPQDPQEVHVAAGAAAAAPQPITATARASAQGGAPAEDSAPPSAAATLDPDAVGDRPPTTMEFEGDAQRPSDRAATTMVVRNVPHGATKQQFLDELNRSGFAGAYDFAYLPIDFKSHVGKGNAFVNFIEPEAAAAFAAAWHRTYRFGLTPSEGIPLNVAAASVQGLQANVDKWTSYRRGRVKNSNFLPFVLHG